MSELAPPSARPLPWLPLACAAAGFFGLLPGAAGAFDALTLLAWLALFAPAGGALCGAERRVSLAAALAVPLPWALVLLALDGRARSPATPLWAALCVAGLFFLGFALARLCTARGTALAGALFFAGLACSGAALGFGLLVPGAELARAHPDAARRLFELSPLTLAYDCAGWDWAHAQPEVYAGAGIEWFQRRPYPGNLAGPAVLVVGCLLAWLADARSRSAPLARRRPPPRSWLCASTSARSPRS